MAINSNYTGANFQKINSNPVKSSTASLPGLVEGLPGIKRMANLLGDSFIKNMKIDGSNLEGSSFADSLYFINTLLNTLAEDYPEIHALLPPLQKCYGISQEIFLSRKLAKKYMRNDLAKKIEDDIRLLGENQTLLFPTGWLSPGSNHAMLLEIKANADGLFDLTVFNTGDGLEYHAFKIAGEKWRSNPVYRIPNVREEMLIGRGFFASLLELEMFYFKASPDPKISSRDIYRGVLFRLEEFLDTHGYEDGIFRTPQRAGSCSIRVIMAYLQSKLNPTTYALLHEQMNKIILLESVQVHQSKMESDLHLRRFFKYCGQSYARRLLKIPQMLSSINAEPATSSDTARHSIENRILSGNDAARIILDTIRATTPEESILGGCPTIQIVPKVIDTCDDVFNRIQRDIQPIEQSQSNPNQSNKTTFDVDLSDISLSLASIAKQLGILSKSGYVLNDELFFSSHKRLCQTIAIHVLRSLPLPSMTHSEEDVWQSLKLEEIKPVIQNLQEIAGTILVSKVLAIDAPLAIYKGMAIAFYLACRVEDAFGGNGPKLSSFGVSSQTLEQIKSIKGMVLSTPQLENEFNQLIDFYQFTRRGKPNSEALFALSHWNEMHKLRNEKDTYKIPIDSADYHYLNGKLHELPLIPMKELQDFHLMNCSINKPIDFTEFQMANLWASTFYVPDAFKERCSFYYAIHQFFLMDCSMDKTGYSNTNNLLNLPQNSRERLIHLPLKLQVKILSDIYNNRKNFEISFIGDGKLRPSFDKLNPFDNKYEIELLHDTPQNKAHCQTSYRKEDVAVFEKSALTVSMIRDFIEHKFINEKGEWCRAIVQKGLFDFNVLRSEFETYPQRSDQLMDTIDRKLFDLKMEANDLFIQGINSENEKEYLEICKPFLFFIKMKFQLVLFIEEIYGSDLQQVKDVMRNELADIVRKHPNHPCTIAPVLINTAALLLLSTYRSTKILSQVDFQFILESILRMHQLIMYDEYDFNGTTDEARYAHVANYGALLNYLSDQSNHHIIYATIRKIYGINLIESECHIEIDDPILSIIETNSTCQRYTFNLINGEFLKNGHLISTDLASFKSDRLYQEIFGDKIIETGFIYATYEKRRTYHVYDEHGNLIILNTTNHLIKSIEKSIDGEDYELMVRLLQSKRDELYRDLGIKYHPDWKHFLIWQNKTHGTFIIEDKRTGKKVMKIERNGTLLMEDQERTVLIPMELTVPWKFLSPNDDLVVYQITDSTMSTYIRVEYINETSFDGSPLRFLIKKDENGIDTYQFQSDPTLFIDENQIMRGPMRSLGFINLRDQLNNRKVLIPRRLRKDYAKGEKVDCYLIDLCKEGVPQPKTTEQRAFMAYQCLMNHEYEEAMKLLEKVHRLQEYTDKELQILAWIFNSCDENQDHVPGSLAVRLYTAWLVHENMIRNGSLNTPDTRNTIIYNYSSNEWKLFWTGYAFIDLIQPENFIFKRITKTFEEYMSVKNCVSHLLRLDDPSKLKTFQEVRYLRFLVGKVSNQKSVVLNERLAFLKLGTELKASVNHFSIESDRDDDHRYTISLRRFSFLSGKNTTTPLSTSIGSKTGIINRSLFVIDENDSNLENAYNNFAKITTSTRPGSIIEKYYQSLFVIAEKGDDEHKKKLMDLACDMRFDPVDSVRAIADLLILYLKSGDNDLITNFKDSELIVSQMIKKSYDLRQSSPFQQTYTNRLNLTKKQDTLLPCDSLLPSLPDLSFTGSSEPLPLDDPLFFREAYQILPGGETSYITSLPDVVFHSLYANQRYRDLKEDYWIGVEKTRKEKAYVLTIEIPHLKCQLESEITIIVNKGRELEENLIDLANKLPIDPIELSILNLEYLGEKRSKPDLSRCIACFLRGTLKSYQAMNPALTNSEIHNLHQLIGTFLMVKTNENKLKDLLRLTDSCTDENKSQLAYQLSQGRSYQIEQFPQALVFEWATGMTLRDDQGQDLKDLLSKDTISGKIPNLIKQRMMGAGKTSVLGIMMALVKADGYHLSVLVPPQALFATNAQDIKIRSKEIFGQKAHTIKFTRDHNHMTSEHLGYIYNTLVEAIKDREFVIVPPETLQALENKYIEAHLEIESEYVIPQTVSLEVHQPVFFLKQILLLLHERGSFTFDEVDVGLLNSRELNYPLGEKISLSSTEMELIGELYYILTTDPHVLDRGLNIALNAQTSMTTEKWQEIKHILIDRFMHKLMYHQKFKKWRKLLALSSFHELRVYLSHKNQPKPDFLKQMATNPEAKTAVELITLLKLQFDEYLPETLSQNVSTHFGSSHIDSNKRYAIPYSYNNKPIEDSEFADPREVINKTIMIALVQGLDEYQIDQFIENYEKNARREQRKFQNTRDWNSLPSVNEFYRLTGQYLPAPLKNQVHHLDKVTLKNILNGNSKKAIALRIKFYIEYELCKYKIYPKQIFHDSQNLGSIPTSLQGYAGILENKDTFPDHLKVEIDPGTKGKILHTLLEQNRTLHFVSEGGVKELLSQVLLKGVITESSSGNYHALIDVGPRFKGIGSRHVAKDILDFYQNTPHDHLKNTIKGVIYWDDQTDLMTFIKAGKEDRPLTLESTDPLTIRSITGCQSHELFYYYSHSKITGADAILPDHAKAIVTFDAKTPLRDWLQGVMRMRKLFANQHVETAIPLAIISLIKEITGLQDPITIEALIPFAEYNESKVQETAIKRALEQKLINYVRQWVKKQMLYQENHFEESQLLLKHKKLFIRETNLDLYSQLPDQPQKIKRKDYAIQLAEKVINPLISAEVPKKGFLDCLANPEAFSPVLRELCLGLQEIIKGTLKKLPKYIDLNQNSDNWNKHVNIQVDQSHQSLEDKTSQQRQLQLQTTNLMDRNRLAADVLKWQDRYITPNFPAVTSELVVSEPKHNIATELYLNLPSCSSSDQWEEWFFNRPRPTIRQYPAIDGIKSTSKLSEAYMTDRSIEKNDKLRRLANSFTDHEVVNEKEGQPKLFILNALMEKNEKLRKYADLFEDQLLVTENFIYTVKRSGANPINLFCDEQKNIYQVIVILKKGQWKVMICTISEADFFIDYMKRHFHHGQLQLAVLDYVKRYLHLEQLQLAVLESNGLSIDHGTIDWAQLTSEQMERLDELLFKVLIIRGDVETLSQDKWQTRLKTWLKVDRKKKRQFFKEIISKQPEFDYQRYKGSALEEFIGGVTPKIKQTYPCKKRRV